ncbi:MAG: OmpA family protein [Candidatus Kapaibacterium sp.]
MYRSITFRLLLFIVVCSIALTSTAGYSQKKKPKKNEKKSASSSAMVDVIERNDSLRVIECKLPLVDSADDRPTFSLDGKIMVFGSRRPPMPGETWRQQQSALFKWDGDIYYRVLTDTGWSIPINPGPPINNGADQNNPTINPRGDAIYYVNGGGGQISESKLVNGKFQTPTFIRGTIINAYLNLSYAHQVYNDTINRSIQAELVKDSELFQRAPDAKAVYYREKLYKKVYDDGRAKFYQGWNRFESAFTPDGKLVLFSENFGKTHEYGLSGEGDDDLWFTTVSPNGTWDNVQAPNGKINSPFAETYPFIAADGQTIYFSSNRPCNECPPGTTGSDDIYMTHITDTGFSKPVPLPPPINSPYGDYGFSIAPDGETAYFVSNRSGKSKFYQVHLRPQDSAFSPKPVIILQGIVTDQVTHKPLASEIFVDELSEQKNSFSVYTDSITGTYTLAMQRGRRYGLQAVSNKHLPKSDRFQFPAKGVFDRTKLDIELSPIEVGSMTELKNVYFEFGKSNLLPESRLELDRAVEFMKKNKNASVEIDGHTDDVGSDAANDALSLARATSVMSYLSSHGIRADRMAAKGFGKTKPLKKGTDEESRAKNRRVEMVISAYAQ